jgi:hypothetical protein
MCIVCVAAAQPEIFVVMGGYAAARGAKPLQRIRGLFQREQDATEANPAAGVVTDLAVTDLAVTDLEAGPTVNPAVTPTVNPQREPGTGAGPVAAAPIRSGGLRPQLGPA